MYHKSIAGAVAMAWRPQSLLVKASEGSWRGRSCDGVLLIRFYNGAYACVNGRGLLY